MARIQEMDLDDLMGKPFMASDDFRLPSGKYREVNMTIRGVEQEMIADEPKPKVVVYFSKENGEEHLKGLVLNATNYKTLKGEYGSKRSGMIGKPVTLFTVDTQTPAGDAVKGIRIRIPIIDEGLDPESGKDEW